jgi:hypothetical protein
MAQVANGWQIHHRFFRSLIAELLVGPIVRRALFGACNGKVNAKRGPTHGSEFRKMVMKNHLMVMKNHFIALGFVLLFAALGFGLELGITAVLLRS